MGPCPQVACIWGKQAQEAALNRSIKDLSHQCLKSHHKRITPLSYTLYSLGPKYKYPYETA